MTVEEFNSSSEKQFILFFVILLVAEYALGVLRDVPTVRVNDGLHSLSAAIISSIPRLLATNVRIASYSFVYQTIYSNSYSDDFSSPLKWCLTFLGVDLGYYWFHRAAHEINILWAAHQVHHSSEDYNITTSLRQSVVQQFVTWVFYIPLAFIGIHPSTLKDHLWFSCLYQIWTHTEVINHLGPLEYVFVTSSHHRVHHGRNPYCIDKNYGGILIIWDRMFGTFAEETEDTPVFGLVVERVNNWNPIRTQLYHYYALLQAIWEMPGTLNKFSLVFKGPSWSPGTPRLGDRTYEPDYPQPNMNKEKNFVEYPIVKYNRTLPLPLKLYVSGHFLLVLLFYYQYLAISSSAALVQTFGVILYLLLSLTTFGSLFDHKWYGPLMEGTRCIISLTMAPLNNHKDWTEEYQEYTLITTDFIRLIFILSLSMWTFIQMMNIDWTGESCHAPLEDIKPSNYRGNFKHILDLNHNCLHKNMTTNKAMIHSREK